MADIRPVGSSRYYTAICIVLRNIRQTSTGGALIRAIAADPGSEIIIQPRTPRTTQCSVAEQNPGARVTALLYNFPQQVQQEQAQRAYALGAPMLHQQGHTMSYTGTGGGTESCTVRISPSNFCHNRELQAALLHELVHGLRMITGQQVGRRMQGWENLEEFIACTIENVLRSEVGLGLRVNHGNISVDPIMRGLYELRGRGQTPRPQSSPPGQLQMRRPADPVTRYELERFINALDAPALRSLAQEFAAHYSNQLRALRAANPLLIDGINGRTGVARVAADFNPLRYIQ